MSAHEDPKRRAGARWSMRARVEREAEGRFRRLARELADVGADAIVVGLATRAATDEARHHEMCVDLSRGFGVEPVRATTVHAVPALRTRIESPSGRVLHEVVAMSCVTETLSAALLVEMRARATDASVRDVVHEVLRDEVAHARLGWAHLAWSKARGDVGWLSPYVPAMLAATVREEIFAEGEDCAPGIEGLGGLDRPTRRDVFVGTMRGVVLPGLQRFGVDTRLAEEWLDEKLGASPQRPRAELLGELREHVRQR
jgi:hypothetical protein